MTALVSSIDIARPPDEVLSHPAAAATVSAWRATVLGAACLQGLAQDVDHAAVPSRAGAVQTPATICS